VCVASITINSQTAVVRLVRQLNYAEVQRLEYVILATDGANATANVTLTIRIIDSSAQGPRFDSDQYNALVQELQTDLLPAITVHVSS